MTTYSWYSLAGAISGFALILMGNALLQIGYIVAALSVISLVIIASGQGLIGWKK